MSIVSRHERCIYQCAMYLHVDCQWHAAAGWSQIWSKYTCQSRTLVFTNMQLYSCNWKISIQSLVLFSLHIRCLEIPNKLSPSSGSQICKIPFHLSPRCFSRFSRYSSNFSNPFPNNALSNGLEHIYLGRGECSINIPLMKSWEQRSALDVCPNRMRKRVKEMEREAEGGQAK